MRMNRVSCPGCGEKVDDRAPACPHCGTKINVEHPGDIQGVKHPPLDPPPGKPKAIAPGAEDDPFPPAPPPADDSDPPHAD